MAVHDFFDQHGGIPFCSFSEKAVFFGSILPFHPEEIKASGIGRFAILSAADATGEMLPL
jgi:hypothetical protein